MDLKEMQKRLAALNQSNQGIGSNNAGKFWKPEIGKSTVRIVPSKFNPDNPFTELKFHGVKGMFKFPVIAPSNFGKQDPIEEFRSKLQQLGGKDNWSLSGKLTPKVSYFVPVIVRGEEEKGVRLWRIGVTIYKALLQLAADEEIGDYTDVVNGTDMVVEKTAATMPGAFPETTVRAKRSSSPLSEDANLVEKWLNEQPNPTECFKQYDYEYIKKALESYLTGTPVETSNSSDGTGEKNAVDQKPAELKVEVTKPAATPKPKAAPQSVTSKFNDLFGTEDDEAPVAKGDDLPF